MKQPQRVLIIDDEIDHCELIEECLIRAGREQLEATSVHTVQDACRILPEQRFSFILLDHNLPDGKGCDVLEQMEEHLLTTPVIGLSTSRDPAVALADVRGGVIDFITKHDAFQGDNLRQRVLKIPAHHARRLAANAIERHRQSTSLRQSSEQLFAAARMDELMQIFNRAVFIDAHAEIHGRAATEVRPYALCIVDIDNFKNYNDHHGHAAGDEVLKQVAKAIKFSIRPGDLVARYGGEEVVVLMEETGNDHAREAAERIRKSIMSLQPLHEKNATHGYVTASLGVTVLDSESIELEKDLFERADQALYAAKAADRNATVIAPTAA